MRDTLAPDSTLGYCTNVHAGVTLDAVRANLLAHALPVKRRFSPDAPMGVGLWFAFEAATQALQQPGAIADLRQWMLDQGLLPYTLNGFPFSDFHQHRVKTRVYQPSWATRERYDYTLALATILSELLPDDADEGSISTLPLGWPASPGAVRKSLDHPAALDPTFAEACAARLTDLTHYLARIELDTGKCIHVDLEPEPGCCIDTAATLIDFFEHHLLGTPDDETIRGYLRVCHDVCHSAVMFEPQAEALSAYAQAGLRVGKVQLSSAVRVPFESLGDDPRAAALAQLRSFCEDRYQHQTSIRFPDGSTAFYADLPDAIDACGGEPGGEWRVHFHVPVYLDRFGAIETTRGDLDDCIGLLRQQANSDPAHRVSHYEVETYAWGVLPEALQRDTLAEGIADELAWVRDGAAPV
ncbi:MAG: metabolite traffic protein EboE [Phycisphaerales bacterium JB063]